MTTSPFQSKPDTKQNISPKTALPGISATLPKIYLEKKNLLLRWYRPIQSAIFRLFGRPDPNRIVPVTVLTGFLGAGKTTLIVNLMRQLPPDYKVAWLKNEFGNTAVDSELAADNNIATVKEMLQGCICHVLIGELSRALEEMLLSDPDRIIIETSGSAAPAPIIWEIRKQPRLIIDGVITVIDAINFPGYKDKSYTAKLQAKYTDLVLINKHEDLSEISLDRVLDDIYDLNPNAPKIKTDRGSVDPELIFGLDSRLFETIESVREEESHTDAEHQHNEAELIEISFQKSFTREAIEAILEKFPKERFYRIKGTLVVNQKTHLLNCAFGSFQLTPLSKTITPSRIIFMGEDIASFKEIIMSDFEVAEQEYSYTPKEHRHEHQDGNSCPLKK